MAAGTRTLPSRFFDNARLLGASPCHHYNAGGQWFPVGWSTAARVVRDLAAGLIERGHEPGDPVAILSSTRREWIYADLATLAARGIAVGIYPTHTAEQCRYILAHSEARYCVVEDEEQLEKVLSCVPALPRLRAIVVVDTTGVDVRDPRVVSYDDLLALGRSSTCDVEARAAEIQLEDAANFIYTSGTTGPPKGAMMTHGGIVAALDAFSVVPFDATDCGFSFLPLAHSLARAVDYVALWKGVPCAYARGIGTVAEDLRAVRPTVMAAVPRIFEKIYANVHEQARAGGAGTQRTFAWACRVGAQVSRHRAAREDVPPLLAARYKLAKRLVFDRLRAKLGGRIRLFITGGAPIAKEILEFFDAAGICILEGWGMAETFSAGTVNLPNACRFGSVGRPLPGIQLRLDQDGELLIKGPNLFAGYYRDEESTAAAFTSDGFFRTGDIARIDKEGYYYIVDRKKDLIVTASGKNIAPQNIENLLKSDSRISEAVVLGDRRPYLVALIAVNTDVRAERTESELYMLVESIVAQTNLELPRFEQVRKFRLLPHELSDPSGGLTPTLKVKRSVVAEKFSYLIDEMYG